jgi:hypothetical protein
MLAEKYGHMKEQVYVLYVCFSLRMTPWTAHMGRNSLDIQIDEVQGSGTNFHQGDQCKKQEACEQKKYGHMKEQVYVLYVCFSLRMTP